MTFRRIYYRDWELRRVWRWVDLACPVREAAIVAGRGVLPQRVTLTRWRGIRERLFPDTLPP